MSEREAFNPISLGIMDTNIIADTEIDNFLGSDPDQVIGLEEEDEKPAPKVVQKSKKEEKNNKENEEEEKPSPAQQVLDADVLGEEEEENEEGTKPQPKKTKEDEKQEPQGSEDNQENVFTSLTKELQNLGVFNVFEDEPEIKDGKDFKDRFNTEIRSQVETSLNNFIARYGEDFQEAFQAIYIDGVSPREYFQQSNAISDLQDFDLTVVDNQKQIIKEYYKSIGWPSDKIAARIQKLEDLGDLEEDATSYHSILLKKEQDQLEEVKRKKAEDQHQKQQKEQHYQSAVTRILNDKIQKKEFDGIPVDQKFAQNVADYITTNKYRAANGDLLTDFDLELLNLKHPDNYEKKVKVAMLLRLMETDPTLSKITKKAISQERDEAFSSLTRQKRTIKKQGEDTYSSWGVSK